MCHYLNKVQNHLRCRPASSPVFSIVVDTGDLVEVGVGPEDPAGDMVCGQSLGIDQFGWGDQGLTEGAVQGRTLYLSGE